MLWRKRLEGCNCHFKGNVVDSACSSKVNLKHIFFKLKDFSNAPVSVEYKASLVKSNVFFKVIYSFKNVSVVLCEVRRFNIFFKLTVVLVFATVAVCNFFSCPGIFRFNFKILFKDFDCYIPFFVVLVVVVKLLHKGSSLNFTKGFSNLAANKLEEINFIRNKSNKLRPDILTRSIVSNVDIAENCLFIIVDGIFFITFFFIMLSKHFSKVSFFKINLYDFCIKLPNLLAAFCGIN